MANLEDYDESYEAFHAAEDALDKKWGKHGREPMPRPSKGTKGGPVLTGGRNKRVIKRPAKQEIV